MYIYNLNFEREGNGSTNLIKPLYKVFASIKMILIVFNLHSRTCWAKWLSSEPTSTAATTLCRREPPKES